jgi:hypothetical protein
MNATPSDLKPVMYSFDPPRVIELFEFEHGRAICLSKVYPECGVIFELTMDGAWIRFMGLGKGCIRRARRRAMKKRRYLYRVSFHCPGLHAIDPAMNTFTAHCWRAADGSPDLNVDKARLIALKLKNLDLVMSRVLRGLHAGKSATDCLELVSDELTEILAGAEASSHDVVAVACPSLSSRISGLPTRPRWPTKPLDLKKGPTLEIRLERVCTKIRIPRLAVHLMSGRDQDRSEMRIKEGQAIAVVRARSAWPVLQAQGPRPGRPSSRGATPSRGGRQRGT